MSLAKQAATNISYLMIARLSFRFLTAAAIVYTTNYLGVERAGMFDTANAWSNALLALSSLGMNQLILREVARDKKKLPVYLGNALVLQTVSSLGLFLIVMTIGWVLPYPPTTLALMAILTIASLIYEYRKVLRGAFRVMQNMRFIAVQEVINGSLFFIITMIICLTVSQITAGMYGLAMMQIVVNSISIIALLWYTLRHVKPMIDVRQLSPMLRQSLIFVTYSLFLTLYFQIDQIILSVMLGPTAVGTYSAATKIVNLFLFIPLMVFQVTTPLMYRWSVAEPEKFKRLSHLLLRGLAAIGWPIAVGLYMLADTWIPLAYHKPEFLGSVAVLQILAIFLGLRFITVSYGTVLTTGDKQHLRALLQIGCIILNIILDIILTHSYGVIGPAIGTTISEGILLIGVVVATTRHLKQSPTTILGDIFPIAAASAGLGCFLYLAHGSEHAILLVLGSGFVYLVLLWLLRFFKDSDRIMLRQLVRKQSS